VYSGRFSGISLIFQRNNQLHQLERKVGENDFGVAVLPYVLQGKVKLLVKLKDVVGVDEGGKLFAPLCLFARLVHRLAYLLV
jgi:ribonuclease HIII